MKRAIIFLMAIISSQFLLAHDFSATLESGQHLYFNITDKAKGQVELTYSGSINDKRNGYVGKLTVPSNVVFEGKTYHVTRVGKKAFADNLKLTGVVLPLGVVEIDDFAFEGCTALRSVVFPGNKVKFGSGTFFRCQAIEQVTIGSDWTEINLKMFRWSTALKEVFLPAKITNVQNLKSLKFLQSVEVDANNTRFKSVDGVLYTKNGATLLGCPRAYTGSLYVAEGTQSVRWGAVADCRNVKEVVLPASVTALSFHEFAHMRSIQRIVMKSLTPIMTAEIDGKRTFLLTFDKTGVELVVAKDAVKKYQSALATKAGNYSDLKENHPGGDSSSRAVTPLEVKSAELLSAKKITGVKDFSKLSKL